MEGHRNIHLCFPGQRKWFFFLISRLIKCQVSKLEPIHLLCLALDHTGAGCSHAEEVSLEGKGSQK